MLFQIEEVSTANLNSGTEQIISVTDKEIDKNYGGDHEYRPVSIRFNNNTGANIEIAMLTEYEYTKYQSVPTISDLYNIPVGVDYEFKDIYDEVTTIIVKGSGGGHVSNLSIYIRQEL